MSELNVHEEFEMLTSIATGSWDSERIIKLVNIARKLNNRCKELDDHCKELEKRVSGGLVVRLMLVVNCHPGEFHLFEKDQVFPMVLPRMLLTNVPGIPNVTGPAAEFDNAIANVNWDGAINQFRCQIVGMRHPTETLEEVRLQLPEWKYVRQLVNSEKLTVRDFLQD